MTARRHHQAREPARRPALAAVTVALWILAVALSLGPHEVHASGPGGADVASSTNNRMTAFASGDATETLVLGTLGLSFANPTDSFGALNPGGNATVNAGDITETDRLADGSAWSITVVASALTAGVDTINQSNLSINSASTFACGGTGCSGLGGASAPGTTTAFSGSTPQTVMTGVATARGEFVQSGVQYTLAVPWGTTASATPYTGTLTYTITG